VERLWKVKETQMTTSKNTTKNTTKNMTKNMAMSATLNVQRSHGDDNE
jgi:hypothetical protein